MPAFIRIFAGIFSIFLASPALAVGFQFQSIPDEAGRPIEFGIWYPSNSEPSRISVGSVEQNAALNGTISGNKLPVVIFSHGSAGWFGDRVETARLFAEQGLVAVSLTYPGDNYKDSSDRAGRQMTNRPKVTSEVLDYVLERWAGRDHLDGTQVGFYGFSAGGFTGLVEIGGRPDWSLFAKHCQSDPAEGVCRQGVASFLSSPQAAAMPASTWHHDSRIKAAALASPGFGFAFDPNSLQAVKIPIRLWGGQRDAVVPFKSNVAYLADHLPNVVNIEEVAGAQHYSFLKSCSEALRAKNLETCSDSPGFDRDAFQKKLSNDLLAFFKTHLMPKALSDGSARK